MASGCAGETRRAAALLLRVAVLAVVSSGASAAHAQNAADAGSSAAAAPAANEPANEPAEPAAALPDGLKTLSAQQSLPENLPGWLQERNRRHPALAERLPAARGPHLGPEPSSAPAEGTTGETSVDTYKRRLRAFDEDGVTVLSNRHAAPPAPLARVATTAAVTVPVPAPEPEPVEEPSTTETRSLRTNQLQARGGAGDAGLRWSTLAVGIALVGLGWVWLRRRRTND